MTNKQAMLATLKSKSEPTLNIQIDDKKMSVTKSVYIKAKTKQMREFGYSGLTESDVEKQIDLILSGKKLGDNGVAVIGGFMEGEILTN